MPNPIIRAANAREKARQEKNQWKARARKAEQRLTAVRELHKPIPNWNAPYCAECNLGRDLVNDEVVPWPCPTRRAIDGDQ